MDSNEKQSGEVIFWNGVLGFIKTQESGDSIFFHVSNLNKKYQNITFLDKVNFIIKQSKSERHLGKPFAHNVTFVSRGSFSEHQRTIGTLRDWNGIFGFLDSHQLDKTVFLFHSRLINTHKETIKNGDCFTFSPIKSSKSSEELFAFFAYPIENEKDINFLMDQKTNNDIVQLNDIIRNIIRQQDEPVDVRFKSELIELTTNENHNFYQAISLLIREYKESFAFTPSFEILEKNVHEIYLIQLWENGVIDDFDFDTMFIYFHNAVADTKRQLITRFTEEQKAEILKRHFSLLLEKGKIDKVNNELKTLLDIVYRNKETQHKEIYREVKKYILEHLPAKINVALWLNDYIDLPEKYIIDNFDISSVPLIKKDNKEYIRIVRSVYENYLLTFAKEKDFDKDYPKLVQYLAKFKAQFSSDFENIAKATFVSLNKHQKFTISLFEPLLQIDRIEYFFINKETLNVYFLIKFLNSKDVSTDDKAFNQITEHVTEERIIQFVQNFEWNDLITPIRNLTADDEVLCFLEEVWEFTKKFNRLDISLKNIGEAIYDSQPYYNVYHLRLWLYGYVEEGRYSYIGFREHFKELSLSEQKIFRNQGDSQIKEEIYEGERLEVEPCTDILTTEGRKITYKAFIENIYFKNESIVLRRENGEYTNPFIEPRASTGLNRISKSSEFNKEFIILVDKNEIIEAKGFEEFFNQIQTGEIEGALGEIIEPKSSNDNRQSYVEDWKLRKEVINYLNEQQFNEFIPKIVNEPKNRYKRLDKNTEIEAFEKVYLYTLLTADGFGIVWENIDLTEDRATFIFKTRKEDYESLINKIANSIVSYGQFRSTLISAKDEEKLKIFKDSHGYIAKIHKQRGKNQPFNNWKSKLENALSQPIPPMPTFEQIESLRYWQADMPFSPRINKKIEKMTVEKTIDPHFITSGRTEQIKNFGKSQDQNFREVEILTKLREINQLFQI